MAYEAAREGDWPKICETLIQAQSFVEGSPVSADGVRPWIRDLSIPAPLKSFLMIGGKPIGQDRLN